jgi:hypothetical protein
VSEQNSSPRYGRTKQSIPITYFPTRNIYHCNDVNLILSYGFAILVTFICIAIGTYATASNGVSHSSVFSAIVATTRNTKLDGLLEGSSLGALPLDQEMSKVKLKFGELLEEGGERRHVAFGFEEEVEGLRKGEMYT